MKKLMISMLAMASMTAMVSCSNENDPIDDAQDQPVEIKMSAGVLNVVTKTAGVITGTKPALSEVAFYKIDVTGSTAPADWSTGTEFEASITGTTGAVVFGDTKPYYQADAANYSYLVGYHPSALTESGTSVDKSTKGTIVYATNGNQDILYAGVVNGNKTTSSLAPTFNHKLAQIIVKIKSDTGGKEAWGSITKIELKDVKNNLSLDLSDGTLTGTGSSASLEIVRTGNYPDIPAVGSEAVEVGYAMVLPQETQYVLTITSAKGTKDVPINIKANAADPVRKANETLAGESYTITLTFKSTEIEMTASVTDWKIGDDNISGDVD